MENFKDITRKLLSTDDGKAHQTDSAYIMSNIKQFSTAKGNRFFISFIPPPDLQTYIFEHDKLLTKDRISKIKFNCAAISSPTRNFATSDNSGSGHDTFIATDQNLAPISISFNCFADMKEKVFFDYWFDFIYNARKRVFKYVESYSCDDFKIIQMDAKNIPKYGLILRKVFPTNIQSYMLDHFPVNTALRLDISLTYSYLESFDYTDNSILANT